MPAIHRSRRSNLDIVEIALRIAADNPDAANRWLERVDEKFRLLTQMPEVGRNRFELASGLRSLAVGNYIVFYRPVSDGIQVIRVLHGARDIPALFD